MSDTNSEILATIQRMRPEMDVHLAAVRGPLVDALAEVLPSASPEQLENLVGRLGAYTKVLAFGSVLDTAENVFKPG